MSSAGRGLRGGAVPVEVLSAPGGPGGDGVVTGPPGFLGAPAHWLGRRPSGPDAATVRAPPRTLPCAGRLLGEAADHVVGAVDGREPDVVAGLRRVPELAVPGVDTHVVDVAARVAD